MAKKSQIHQNPAQLNSLEDIGLYDEDAKASLRHYFNSILEGEVIPESKKFLTEDEIKELLNRRLDETDARSSLILLTFIESQFRLHYKRKSKTQREIRAELKRKHGSSHQKKIARPSLEDDLIEAWKKVLPGESVFLGDLKTAFKYRHWLAHGRYFTLKSKKPAYDDLFLVAQKVVDLCKA
jgi:hypothetical protein